MRMPYGFVKHLSICIDREILFISDGKKQSGNWAKYELKNWSREVCRQKEETKRLKTW